MNQKLSYGYRVSAWLVEMLTEIAIILCAAFWLIPSSPYLAPLTARDIAGGLYIIITAFFFSGYAITTLIARLLLHGRGLYLYAAIAPVLFLAHFQLMNHLTWGGLFEPHVRFVFRVYGCAFVLVVTTVVSLVLKRAEERTKRQPPALPAHGGGAA